MLNLQGYHLKLLDSSLVGDSLQAIQKSKRHIVNISKRRFEYIFSNIA